MTLYLLRQPREHHRGDSHWLFGCWSTRSSQPGLWWRPRSRGRWRQSWRSSPPPGIWRGVWPERDGPHKRLSWRDNRVSYSDEISDLKEIEEGPEKGDHEAGDDHEEEPVIVTQSEGFSSNKWDPCSRCGTGHANHSKYLKWTFHDYFYLLNF